MGSPSDPGVVLPERYEPVRHLADGGMASVWEARDTVLDRPVAVKLLSRELASDRDARERFTREARAAARLGAHPHVVTIHDAGEHDDRAYIVMALYSGGTVADRLREGLPDRAVALRWLEQAADGLDAAHAEGIVHRDVKPANLLLDDRDRVAVGDFGIATAAWAASVTRTGLVVGTAAYLAPEQRAGRAATPASDRYALGLVARELLTGERPGGAGTASGRAVAPLDAAAEAAIGRATALDPADRPASCRAFIADLERALGAPDDATGVLPVAEDDRTAVHRRRGVAGAAAAGLAGAQAAEAAPRTPRPPRREPVPPAPDTPGPDGERGGDRRRSLLPLALLAAFLVSAGVTAAIVGGGGDDERATGSTGTTATTEERDEDRAGTTTTEAAEAPAPAEEPAAPAPDPAPEPEPTATEDPRELNDRGYQLFLEGRYDEAIPLLSEAVAGLEATPGDEYYAYALYNLGAALRRAGRPGEAIPYLERRLEVSDFKRGVVVEELDAAYAEAGVAPRDGRGNGRGAGRGNGRGPDRDD